MAERVISVEEFEQSIDEDELVNTLIEFGLIAPKSIVVPKLTDKEFKSLLSDDNIDKMFKETYTIKDKEEK